MALGLGTVYVQIGAKTQQLEAGLKAASAKMDKFAADARRASLKASIALTGITVAGKKVLQMGADFERAMVRVKAVSNATVMQYQELTKAALDYAGATEYTARQVADGMGFMAMAGFKTNQIIEAMPSVLQLATAGMMDLGRAADITTNILTGYGMEVKDLSKANDVLVSAMTGANVDLEMLGQSFKYAGPVAKAAGVKFEETAAAIALMGNAGIQGTMAGTALRGALSRLLNPTTAIQTRLKKLGVAIKDRNGNIRNFVDILADLERVGMSAADAMEIFGDRAGPAMQALIDQGTGSLRQFVDRLERSGGIAARIEREQLNTLSGQLNILKSQFEAIGLTLQSDLMPYIKGTVKLVQDITAKFNNLTQEQRQQIEKWGAITVAVLGGIAAFGLIATAAAIAVKGLALLGGVLGIITSPVVLGLGLIALGSATLKTAWDENWGGIQDKTRAAWAVMEPVYTKFKEWVGTAWKWTIETAGKAWDWIVDTTWQEKLEDIRNWLSSAWTWTINKAGDAWDWLGEAAPWLTGALETAWTWSVNAGDALFTWIKDDLIPWLVGPAKDGIVTAWEWSIMTGNKAFTWLMNTAWPWINNTVETVWKFSVEGLDWLRDLISGKDKYASMVFTDRQKVIGNLPNIPTAIGADDRSVVQRAIDAIKNKFNLFHDGALLPGTSGGDKFPALLAPGEAVVPASAVNAGPVGVAEWFRSMGAPGFAEGYFPRSLGGQFSAVSGWLDELGEGLSQITKTIIDSFKRFFSWLGDALITLVETLFPDLAPKLREAWEKVMGYFAPGAVEEDRKQQNWRNHPRFFESETQAEMTRWQQIIARVKEYYNNFTDTVNENSASVHDMAEGLYRLNPELGDAVHGFQDILDVLADIPALTQSIIDGMGAVKNQLSTLFGGGKIGNILGTLGAGYLGAQAFGQGSGGGTNWVGAVGGFMSAIPGLNVIGGAMAAGSSLVNALFPGKEKSKDDQALQSRIKDMNKTLREWGADFQSENLWFKKDSGFLGWRNLFGNVKWETMNKEAAEKGAEIAEQLIQSMTTTFDQLGQGLGEVLFSGGDFEDFGKFVGRRMQQVLLDEMLESAAIEGPLQQLSAYITEAVEGGFSQAELDNINSLSEAVFAGLSGWSDVAADIAEQFGLAEDAANGITGALRNVPSGFKLAFSEFAAARGIPALASGGIVTRPTLAMVGEAGPEAVVPLDGRSAGLTVKINGDVYGYDDFKRKVAQATGEINRSSSLARVGVG